MDREYWQHKASGDLFGVLLNDDRTARYAYGPLKYREITRAYLGAIDFGSDDEADAVWLNDQPIQRLDLDRQDDEPGTCSTGDADCSGHA